ncbi:MAG: hypothetical protein BroJett018_34340 [Chloroflexota bacterium]|nr:hypothetical protein [Chloroflexota bacterium]NOG64056.1 hypothetical protein [Chloroflexota bacterium]GIK65640.1 MAG: hypothetical protein BroJett018_34340 [Chloroflexota bacterium]
MIQDDNLKVVKPQRDSIMDIVGRKIGYFVTIVVTMIGVVVVGMVPDWDLSFIRNAKFEDWLPYFYLSCAATVLANCLLLGLDPYRLRHLMQIFTNAFSLVSMLALISIFPFRFEDDTLDTVVHIALWLGVLGICISFITEGVKVLVGQREKQSKGKVKVKAKHDEAIPQ